MDELSHPADVLCVKLDRRSNDRLFDSFICLSANIIYVIILQFDVL